MIEIGKSIAASRPLTRWGSPAEQETTIRWDRESGEVSIFTGDPTVAKRIERSGLEAYRESMIQGKPVGRWYRLPKGSFRFKVGRRALRVG